MEDMIWQKYKSLRWKCVYGKESQTETGAWVVLFLAKFQAGGPYRGGAYKKKRVGRFLTLKQGPA